MIRSIVMACLTLAVFMYQNLNAQVSEFELSVLERRIDIDQRGASGLERTSFSILFDINTIQNELLNRDLSQSELQTLTRDMSEASLRAERSIIHSRLIADNITQTFSLFQSVLSGHTPGEVERVDQRIEEMKKAIAQSVADYDNAILRFEEIIDVLSLDLGVVQLNCPGPGCPAATFD